jgi:hypothetical protein
MDSIHSVDLLVALLVVIVDFSILLCSVNGHRIFSSGSPMNRWMSNKTRRY